jgi:hypothetical protein
VAFALGNGARAGDDDGLRRDDEWQFRTGTQHVAEDEIKDWGAAGEDGPRGKDSALPHNGALVDAAIAADKDVVFNDDGAGVDGLEHAADLRRGAEVNALANLRAGADERMRIDHGALIDPCAGVDVHGWHADHAAGEVGAGADG